MTLKYSYWYAPGMGLQFEVDRGKSRCKWALLDVSPVNLRAKSVIFAKI